MEERFFVKITCRNGLEYRQIHLNLFKLPDAEMLSHSEMCSWGGQFFMDLVFVKDARGTGRSRFRSLASNSKCARGAVASNCSVHCRGYAHSCTDRILHLGGSTGREIPSLAMGAPPVVRCSKVDREQQALPFLAALKTAEKRKYANFGLGMNCESCGSTD
jgi:hypothetical protein